MTTKKLGYSFAAIIAAQALAFSGFLGWIVYKGTETTTVITAAGGALLVVLAGYLMRNWLWKKYNKTYINN